MESLDYGINNEKASPKEGLNGALGRIRTLNPQSRNLVFYPVELRVPLKRSANIGFYNNLVLRNEDQNHLSFNIVILIGD